MDENNFNLLKKNLGINESKNVDIYNAAVTDINGKVSYIKKSKRPSPISSLSRDNKQKKFGKSISVQGVTLDSFFKDNKLNPDIIKIDVEGAEMRVLNGMQNTLDRGNIKLFVEIHPVNLLLKFQSSANALISMLIEKGYDVFEIKNMRRRNKETRLKKLNSKSQSSFNTMLLLIIK